MIYFIGQPSCLLPLHVAVLTNVELLHLGEDGMALMLHVLALVAQDELDPLCRGGHWGKRGNGEFVLSGLIINNPLTTFFRQLCESKQNKTNENVFEQKWNEKNVHGLLDSDRTLLLFWTFNLDSRT